MSVRKLTISKLRRLGPSITILSQCRAPHLEQSLRAESFDGLTESIKGLYHAGSVGIIMSGWLGTMNYGVIVANKMDKQLYEWSNGVDCLTVHLGSQIEYRPVIWSAIY